jgi:hypothetical protein
MGNYSSVYYYANRERIQAQQRNYRIKKRILAGKPAIHISLTEEQKKRKRKAYYLANAEERRAYSRIYFRTRYHHDSEFREASKMRSAEWKRKNQ